MAIEFTISTIIKASPEVIYKGWLSSEGHTKMTGSPAEITDKVGAEFEAWDGCIQGKNLELDDGKCIVQSWRTVEFSEEEEDSRLEITLELFGDGTKITLHHTNLPSHGMQYKQGWVENYFYPMKEYFRRLKISKDAKESLYAR